MKKQTIKNLKTAAAKINQALTILKAEQELAHNSRDYGTSEFLRYEIKTLEEFMSSDGGECGFESFINLLGEK